MPVYEPRSDGMDNQKASVKGSTSAAERGLAG